MAKPYRIAVFLLLAFPLSWYPWILALLRGKTSGPNPLGPLAAAIIVTAFSGGKGGLERFFGRLVRFRVGARWYAVVFLLPLALCVTAAGIAALLGARALPLSSLPGWKEVPERFLFILLFIGLGEEPGWRGFLLPELQRSRSPLASSLILAPIWALWHLPLFGTEFPPPVVPAFLVSILGGTLVQTWLFNRTRESVWLQMLFHATVNTVGAGLVFRLFAGRDLILLWWVYSALWLLVAAVVTLLGRRGDEASRAARLDPARRGEAGARRS